MNNSDVSVFVLSCDKYSDLWDDFFNLKERFWPSCPYNTYLITEEKHYQRSNVNTICCGANLMWGERFKHAVESVTSQYIILFLDDFFICKAIDDNTIVSCISLIKKANVSYYRMGDAFGSMKRISSPCYIAEHVMIIPSKQKYGVSTAEAIWERGYLLQALGNGRVSAWQFELDRCNEASSEQGMPGVLYYDERNPLNVTSVPVVIQGKYYPKAIEFFRKIGYEISTGDRPMMTRVEVLRYDLIDVVYRVRFARGLIKKVGKLLGFKFIS